MSTDASSPSVGAALALFAAAGLAWGWLLTGAGMDMEQMDAGPVLAMWAVMMVAMMLPGAANAILGAASPFAFTVAYLAVWTAFSLFASLAQIALHRSGLLSDAMALRNEVAAGLVILAVGLYELTPMKHACLLRCTSHVSRGEGAMQSLREGFVYGLNCVGCCWALMALLFAAGVMSLFWVAAIALWIAAEKLLSWGGRLTTVAGAGLATMGATWLALMLH